MHAYPDNHEVSLGLDWLDRCPAEENIGGVLPIGSEPSDLVSPLTTLVSFIPISHLLPTIVNRNYNSYQCERNGNTSPDNRRDVGRVLTAIVASTIWMCGCRGAILDRRRRHGGSITHRCRCGLVRGGCRRNRERGRRGV